MGQYIIKTWINYTNIKIRWKLYIMQTQNEKKKKHTKERSKRERERKRPVMSSIQSVSRRSDKTRNSFLSIVTSVTRFGKIFKVLGNFSRVYLLFGKIVNPLWQILYTFGQIFIDVNDQMLKNNLASRSHWICHIVVVFFSLGPMK